MGRDRHQADSGLYFAGTDLLTATGGFMPMVMYNQGCRPTLDGAYFGRDEIESRSLVSPANCEVCGFTEHMPLQAFSH